jgi:putative transposase
MKKTRFTETQIIGILKETEAGLKVEDVCRKHKIAASTYYKPRRSHGRVNTTV